MAYNIVRPACKPGYRGSGLRQLGPQDTCILSEVLACAPLPALFDCHRRSDCLPGKQFLSTIIDSSLLAIQCCFIQSLSKENWPSRPPNCVPRSTDALFGSSISYKADKHPGDFTEGDTLEALIDTLNNKQENR